jgi:hypothetical protein
MAEEPNKQSIDDLENLWTALRGTDLVIRRIFVLGGIWSILWIALDGIGLDLLSDLVLGLGTAILVVLGSLGLAFEWDDRRQGEGPE